MVDASALSKQFLDEDRAAEFRKWLAHTLDVAVPVTTAGLALREVGRALQKARPNGSAAEQNLVFTETFSGIHVAADPPTWESVWMSAAEGLSFFDAEYVELARRTDSTLVTADRKQLKAARRLGIPVLSFVPGGEA